MRNVIFFVILAVLTVAALVGWNAVRRQNPSSTNTTATSKTNGSPTPTTVAGTAVGRDSALGNLSNPGSTNSGYIATSSGATKGGVAFTSPAIPTSTPTPASLLGGTTTRTATPTITPTPVVAPVANVVTYTDSGFNPKTLTIKTGTMVKFLNQSSKRMWIISQEVAGGKKLEGMNMGTSVGKDGFYEYQFNTLGTWGFTDQNNQSQSGTVVVNQ